MRLIYYIEIENFKSIGLKQRIELDHPAVLIGPNNCGKTSVIQALSLWSMAVKTWFNEKNESKAKKRVSIPLNRLNIVSVPVQKTRFFWRDGKVRTGNDPIPMVIAVGVLYKNKVEHVAMHFKNDGDDIVYCTPDDPDKLENGLIEYAAALDMNILYCMSGLETDEAVVKPNRIDYYLGKGQTAQVLRNLCLLVYQNTPDDWKKIQKLMHRLFHVNLEKPVENNRGAIDLYYSQRNGKEPFEITSSGRGFQEMLLIFSYLFSHKKSILLIDEPDAHLEILRQKQVFVLLRDIASQNESQVVLVTHSEVVLEEALSTNLTLLLDGRSENLANKTDIRESLKVFGADHYIRARERGYVFYTEGGTDVDILRALAEKIRHPVAEIWDEEINSFYVQNNFPEITDESELERVEGGFGISPRDHFNSLRKLIPGLIGLAILDNDGRNRQNRDDENLIVRYWKRYEVENYILSPELLLNYVEQKRNDIGLFSPDLLTAKGVINSLILEQIFGKNQQDFTVWNNSSLDAARLIWDSKTERIKLSGFAEEFFKRLSEKTGGPILLRKGEFHQLVEFIKIDEIPNEVKEKLDLLKTLFKNAGPIIFD